jgi:hypothetical protein
MGWALRNDDAEFGQMSPQGVDDLRSLAHQEIARAEDDSGSLRLFALHGDKSHSRALGCLADRLGIGSYGGDWVMTV